MSRREARAHKPRIRENARADGYTREIRLLHAASPSSAQPSGRTSAPRAHPSENLPTRCPTAHTRGRGRAPHPSPPRSPTPDLGAPKARDNSQRPVPVQIAHRLGDIARPRTTSHTQQPPHGPAPIARARSRLASRACAACVHMAPVRFSNAARWKKKDNASSQRTAASQQKGAPEQNLLATNKRYHEEKG